MSQHLLTSADPEEDPDIHRQAEPERQRDIEQHRRIRRLRQTPARSIARSTICSSCGGGIRHLCASEGEEEEQEGPAEFSHEGDEVVANFVWQEAEDWDSQFILGFGFVFGGSALHARELQEGFGRSLDVHRDGRRR